MLFSVLNYISNSRETLNSFLFFYKNKTKNKTKKTNKQNKNLSHLPSFISYTSSATTFISFKFETR